MNDRYYSVEQISKLINMHPKTIQRYIREGKLCASKVGKSWRVNGHDLSAFMENQKIKGNKIDSTKEINREIKVSSVIDIDISGMDEATRIISTINAALNTNILEHSHSSVYTQFLESEYKVRVTIWGNIQFAQAINNLIITLTESIKQEDDL